MNNRRRYKAKAKRWAVARRGALYDSILRGRLCAAQASAWPHPVCLKQPLTDPRAGGMILLPSCRYHEQARNR